MTREESKMMQGVAILLMIFYHLFNPNDAPEYEGSIIGKIAAVNNPVPFYVFLSGYGLYKSYITGVGKSFFSRSLILYSHYWLILTSFLLLSYILKDLRCQIEFPEIANNYLGLKSTYYLPSWFILPYCILIVISSYIFKAIENMGSIISLIIGYSIYVVSAILNRYTWFQANILQVFYITFPFILGTITARNNIYEKVKEYMQKLPSIVPIFLLVLLFIVRVFVPTGAVISFYAGTFILLFTVINKKKWFKRILYKLGKANLNMWMIHAWICWYLFRNEIYGLRNPLYMFITVTFVSYVLAICFDYIYKTIDLITKRCLIWIKRN